MNLFPEKVVFVGNYLPRKCGIATFTSDLRNAVASKYEGTQNFPVIAMDDRPEGYDYPTEVEQTIFASRTQDYIRASDYVNRSNARVLCLQHEYGIYGGEKGNYILDFLSQLNIPSVATLHTVLEDPTVKERDLIAKMAEMVDRFIVMNPLASKFLQDAYEIPKDQIALIHHGIPETPPPNPNFHKERINLKDKRVLLTFGLLERNKGIETVLSALPDIVKKFPDIAYVILGATHPGVIKREGEAYRIFLRRMVQELDLEDHVFFHDEFVSLSRLTEYLSATDIYITPYLNENRITSGTLAYASGMGLPTLSTPYWYARDIITNGGGELFPFSDSGKLKKSLIKLLSAPEQLQKMRESAYRQGREMIWPTVASRYINLFQEIIAENKPHERKFKPLSIPAQLPEISLKHVNRLTDRAGILRQAVGIVPDRKAGYRIDDNARAKASPPHSAHR